MNTFNFLLTMLVESGVAFEKDGDDHVFIDRYSIIPAWHNKHLVEILDFDGDWSIVEYKTEKEIMEILGL